MRPYLFATRRFLLIVVTIIVSHALAEPQVDPAIARAVRELTPEKLLGHVKVLSSDEFEGRAPGTPGEQRTVDYLVDQFKQFGLAPGGPDGSYIQNVPLVGFTAHPSISFTAGKEAIGFHFPNDAVIWSRRPVAEIRVEESPVVFVGYGVVAPEYGWDDFKDVDVRGKTVLMLINDPPIPDPADASKLDPKMFKGEAMTYYGRWTYKFESAAAHGAKGAIIVHQTGPAGYPWGVVMISNGRELFDLAAEAPGANAAGMPTHCDVEGWITIDNARKILTAAGQDFDALKAAATRRDFRPVAIDLKGNFVVKSELRKVDSSNVIAKIEGSDPALKNEYVIYTGHWDHLGMDAKLPAGAQIFHGAADNASGVGALLEIARAFSVTKPKRTVLFLAVTAEEKGLLGSKYYATHPLYPLKKTVANINIDGVSLWGRTHDVPVVGFGQSSLEDLLVPIAAAQGRVVRAESDPAKGYYFRSDHFEFAKVGVPALYLDKGIEVVGKPEGYGKAKRQDYTAHDYHQVTDTIKADWDLSGAAEDAALLFEVGYALAQGAPHPQWKPGSEFKAIRDKMMFDTPH